MGVDCLPRSEMTPDEVAAMFADADAARREGDAAAGLDFDHDPEELFDVQPGKLRRGASQVVTLANGDVHVCFGSGCPHLVTDSDGTLVCGATGVIVGVQHAANADPNNTGRCSGSANPDDTAGTPQGGWMKRRDMWSASVEAHRYAAVVGDEDVEYMPTQSEKDAKARQTLKRGALCVDEVAVVDANKRCRASKRELVGCDALQKLTVEASGIIDKLVSTTRTAGDSGVTEQKLDPRLQNVDFVRKLAVRRWLKHCAEGSGRLCLDSLNDVFVNVNNFVKEQRELARAQNDATLSKHKKSKVFSGWLKYHVSKHIVTVWRMACLSEHMVNNARHSDSFRPFVAGVLYGLKRGVFLNDGRCVVPPLEALAAELPQLRSQNATAAAKQLHSSSHRGLCTLHHAISSLTKSTPSDDCLEAVNQSVRSAAELQKLVLASVR